MKFKEAAKQVLENKGEPLTPKEITREALEKNMISTEGKTPEKTMAAILYKDVKKKDSNFKKVDKGVFGLREQAEEKDKKPEKEIVNAEEIKKRLKEFETKSRSYTDFEKALKDAFSFLGFESELIGGSGDTDVLLTANIGDETYKVNVDGKTSKTGRIKDAQVDWESLEDHREKNDPDFVVLVGPDFSGGNLKERAKKHNVTLLTSKKLRDIIHAHSKLPINLKELKNMFRVSKGVSATPEDTLSQNQHRRFLLEQFETIIEEMESIQDNLGYFSKDSLSARKEIQDLEIEPKDISHVIKLLELPFINSIDETSNGYILTLNKKDISNIFHQISDLLVSEIEREKVPSTTEETKEEEGEEMGTKYFEWKLKGSSIVAKAREEDPYEHYCPIEHFRTVIKTIIDAFDEHDVIRTGLISSMLDGENLAPERPYKGKKEVYKVRMALGILEREKLLKWTGSKRPIEYKLDDSIDDIKNWKQKNLA